MFARRPILRLETLVPVLPVFILAIAVVAQKPDTAGKKTTPPPKEAAGPQEFGKSYATLRPAQRRLIDDFIRRYNQTTGKNLVAQTAYDSARMSVRTTYDAVTHALLTSKITDAKGKSLGHAINLVDAIDDIMGQEQGVGGDRQFRLYVYLKPNAYDVLARSREFKRERDNTVYHKGFPTCFRLEHGPPSIQISMSRDRRMADIDVDYRSSTFPQALFNGHLTASNSDVRAGNNLDRHDGRWQGLNGWWREIFGFYLGSDAKLPKETATTSAMGVPLNPRVKANRGVDEVMHDMLKAWVIDKQTTQAIAYFSLRSYPCLNAIATRGHKPIPPGMARVRLKMAMDKLDQKAGAVSSVDQVFQPPKHWSPALKDAPNKYPDEFRLVAVPPDLGAANECIPPAESEKKSKEKYYAAAFRGKVGDPNTVIYLLWAKEGDYWKIIAINALDANDADITPNPETPAEVTAEAAPKEISGNPAAIRDISDFYETWLVKQDPGKAMGYVSTRSYACLSPPPAQEKSARPEKRIRQALEHANQVTSRGTKLSDMMLAIQPVNEFVRPVEQKDSEAFAIMAPPDQMADSFLCGHRSSHPRAADLKLNELTYGKYYATASRLKLEDEESPAILLLWTEEQNRWKVVAWDLEVP
jgi:hypothetical protein